MKKTLVIVLGVDTQIGGEVFKALHANPGDFDAIGMTAVAEASEQPSIAGLSYNDYRLLIVSPSIDRQSGNGLKSSAQRFLEVQNALRNQISYANLLAESCVKKGAAARIVLVSQPDEDSVMSDPRQSLCRDTYKKIARDFADTFLNTGITITLFATQISESWLIRESEKCEAIGVGRKSSNWIRGITLRVSNYLSDAFAPEYSQVIDI